MVAIAHFLVFVAKKEFLYETLYLEIPNYELFLWIQDGLNNSHEILVVVVAFTLIKYSFCAATLFNFLVIMFQCTHMPA